VLLEAVFGVANSRSDFTEVTAYIVEFINDVSAELKIHTPKRRRGYDCLRGSVRAKQDLDIPRRNTWTAFPIAWPACVLDNDIDVI